MARTVFSRTSATLRPRLRARRTCWPTRSSILKWAPPLATRLSAASAPIGLFLSMRATTKPCSLKVLDNGHELLLELFEVARGTFPDLEHPPAFRSQGC